jgi:hypothetical protein
VPDQLASILFLFWRGGMLKSFELRVKVKDVGTYSGIHYRTREFLEVGRRSVVGYQFDTHPSPANNSMIYGETWKCTLVQNQSVVIDPKDKCWLVSEVVFSHFSGLQIATGIVLC